VRPKEQRLAQQVLRQAVKVLTLTGTAYFARNEAVPVKVAEFNSLLTGVRLTYKMTRALNMDYT